MFSLRTDFRATWSSCYLTSFRTRSQAARGDLPAEVPPPVLERAGATACVAADELFSAWIIQRRDPAALCLGRPVVSPVVRARGP